MTLTEIYRALLDGKKICKKEWINNRYIMLGDTVLLDETGNVYTSYFGFIDEWLIYEESKPKVTRLQYMYKQKDKVPTIDTELYENESDFLESFGIRGNFIEWYKIIDEIECES